MVKEPTWPSLSQTIKLPYSEENTGMINRESNEFVWIETFTVSTDKLKFPAYQK
ncbi:hypothetical protein TUM20903_39280 [Citrobacter koseri]|nr:hypothetical protein TUM13189_39480 [Citrobacter koseri]BDG91190.1 hypothetical protein TUM20903_39280 [Citrobacter koseri]